jgi:predicted ABC-type exoprotein transport system permease subunit
VSRDEGSEQIRWGVVWNLIVLVVLAAILLPAGRWRLLWELTRAFAVLWGVLLLAAWLMHFIQRKLRVEDDPPSDAYLLSNAAVGVLLLVAWGGYTALLVRGSAAGAPLWAAVVVHAAGVLAAHAAFSAVCAVYHGSFYRLINLAAAIGAFAGFAAWPPAARALFGWLA